MQQQTKTVTTCHFFHNGHHQQILVDSQVTFSKNRSKLKLVRGYFVVTGFHWNTELISLKFQIFHISCNTGRYRTKIMVFHLLIFGRLVTDQCTTGEHKVRPGSIQSFVNQKILLFPAKISSNFFYVRVKHLTNRCGCFVDSVKRFEQWSFHVERFAGIGDEYGRDTKCIIHHKSR